MLLSVDPSINTDMYLQLLRASTRSSLIVSPIMLGDKERKKRREREESDKSGDRTFVSSLSKPIILLSTQ